MFHSGRACLSHGLGAAGHGGHLPDWDRRHACKTGFAWFLILESENQQTGLTGSPTPMPRRCRSASAPSGSTRAGLVLVCDWPRPAIGADSTCQHMCFSAASATGTGGAI